jgi:MarR family transcriptional regulator, negative regulator of the multidrug operon emrRAB
MGGEASRFPPGVTRAGEGIYDGVRYRTANLFGVCALDATDAVRRAVLDAGGTDLSGAAMLSALDQYAGGGSIDELSRVLGLSHSGAVRIARRLEDRGLVTRSLDPVDRRVVRLGLTAAGRARAADVRRARLDALDARLATLDDTDHDALTGILERLWAGAVRDRAHARHVCRLCDVDVCGHPDRCPVTREVPA